MTCDILEVEVPIVRPQEQDPTKCWLCNGLGKVEWDSVKENGVVEQGVYDPCPECNGDGKAHTNPELLEAKEALR